MELKPKIILLPGLDGTGDLFRPLLKSLPKGLDVQVINYPLFQKLSYLELVSHVVSQLPQTPFILVGESFSGAIAHQIVLQQPANLKGVVFLVSFLQTPRSFLLGLASLLPLSLMMKIPMPDFLLKRFLFSCGAGKELNSLFRASLKRVSPQVLAFRLHELRRMPQIMQKQGNVDVKALYIRADDDWLVPWACIQDFRICYNNLKIVTVSAGHLVAQGRPQPVADVIGKMANDCK